MTTSRYTLEESIRESKICIEKLLDNRFNEAIELSGKYAHESMYHSHGHSILLWLKAYLSLEMPEIEIAQKSSAQTLALCEAIRPQNFRDNFIVKLFIKPSYEEFSDEEIHAELIRTEQIVFGSMLEFFVEPSLFGLVKISVRLRNSYLIYKAFSKIFDTKEWSSTMSLEEFKSAVKLGLGVYNLMFSTLPEKVLTLLSVVGYKGSRYEGLKMLNESALADTLHSFSSKMVVGAFECFIEQAFNVYATKAPTIEKHIQTGLKINDQCIWFLIFKGRLRLIEKDVEGALQAYQGTLELTVDVKQMANLYIWEIMWCQSLLGNWEKAHEFASQLRQNCNWSLPTFYYMEAAFLYMHYEQLLFEGKDDFYSSKTANKMRQQVKALLSEVPVHVKRYAGRRIPIEKCVCEKVEQFNEDGILVVPGYELLLAWNIFIFIEGQKHLIDPILNHLEQCQNHHQFGKSSEYYLQICLLKGVCYRCLGEYSLAEAELFKVVERFEYIKRDKHLSPMTALELAIVKMYQHRWGEARHWFNRTKSDFPSYALELLVQMRVHRSLKAMRAMMRQFQVPIE